MTHFTVLVAADSEADLEKKLVPYYEYGCSEYFDELVQPFLVFKNVEEEYRKKYETETTKRVVLPDGTLVALWDEKFKVPDPENPLFTKTVIPEDYEQRDVPYKELYPDVNTFIEEYTGHEYQDGLGYGYWCNPNKKWDWYSVGGRWEGILLLKDGKETSQATAGEVDWEAMRLSRKISAIKKWNAWELALALANVIPTEYLAMPDEQAREVRQTLHRKLAGEQSSQEDRDWYYEFVMFDRQDMITRDGYVEKVLSEGLTWAYVDPDGKWYQQAECGWWGSSWDEQPAYGKLFWELVQSLKADQNLYVVDCHI